MTPGVRTALVALALTGIPAQAPAQAPSRCCAAALPAPALPRVAESNLDNGLHLIVIEQKQHPSLSFQLSIPGAGFYDEAGGPSVIARATARLLEQGGTLTRSSTEIQAALTAMSGQLSVEADSTLNNVEMRGRCPVENATKLLELASDIMLHPAFPEEDVERVTQDLRASLAESTDPAFDALEIFDRFIDRNRRLEDLASYSPAVEDITRDRVVDFYRTHYTPNHAVLAVAGDVSPFAAKFYISQKLGAWKTGTTDPPSSHDAEAEFSSRIILLARPGLPATAIVARSEPVARTDRDYEVLELMNWVTVATAGDRPAYFFEGSDALDEIHGLRSLHIDAEELAEAKRALIDSYRNRLESPVINEYAITRWREKLPLDYWDTYEQRVDSVTAAQVEAAAEKYLAPERLQMVVVGDSEMTGPLEKIGPVERLEAP